MLIDHKGRIFGKINIIDLTVLVFLIATLPMFYFGYKLITKPKPLPERIETYTISRECPNCGTTAYLKIPDGELVPKEWIGLCETCGNKVAYIEASPKPFETLTYEEMWYKEELKQRGITK